MLKQVPSWIKLYGSAGIPEQRAVQDFVECETAEAINSLKNELVGIAQGNSDDETLDKLVGQKRKVLYNSYQEWAKMMLLWLASYHRGH